MAGTAPLVWCSTMLCLVVALPMASACGPLLLCPCQQPCSGSTAAQLIAVPDASCELRWQILAGCLVSSRCTLWRTRRQSSSPTVPHLLTVPLPACPPAARYHYNMFMGIKGQGAAAAAE